MDYLKALQEPFHTSDIEWRIQQSGVKNGKPWAIVLAYITNRAIMERLDNVFGPFGWKNKFSDCPNNVVECGISVKSGDEWVTKWDAAPPTDIESVKGGRSNSMKRAAVQWGIGRYLYHLEASFAECFTEKGIGQFSATFQESKYNPQTRKKEPVGQPIYGSWNPPILPDWALPERPKNDVQIYCEDNGINTDNVLRFISNGLKTNITAFYQIPDSKLDDVLRAVKAHHEKTKASA